MFRNLVLSSVIGIVLASSQSPAAPVTYTIDPSQSILSATGTLSDDVPSSQTFGSNLTTYTGTINADRTAASIQFTFGSFIDADRQPSKQQPDIGGEPGSAVADYGLRANHTFGTTYAAFRDLVFDLSSDPLTVAGNGNFPGTFDVSYSSGSVDWYWSQWGSQDFTGRTLFSESPNTPSVVVANGIETLTLPIRFNTVFSTVTTGDSSIRFSGNLIATRNLNDRPPQWIKDGDGSWDDPANWDGGIPSAADATANFLGAITAPRTITLDGDRSIRSVNFNNPQAYTIAPGTGGTLTIGLSGVGSISTDAGSHLISAKVVFAGPTSIDLESNSPLSLGGGIEIAAFQTVTKTGPGLLFVGGPQSHQVGSMLAINDGHVDLYSNAGAPATATEPASANLSISIGNESSTTTLGASQNLASLVIAYEDTGAQGVDLASTASEFHSISIHGGDLDSAKASLSAAINHATVTPGDGIFDSGLHANSAIGIARLTDAHGDAYVLIRPTRTGDLNLDGQVTISDFIDLASHFNTPGGWQEGDLNGDNQITISDFIDLASNFNSSYSGAAWAISDADLAKLSAFAAEHGVTLVPEPSVASLLFLAYAVATAGRLRRTARRSPGAIIQTAEGSGTAEGCTAPL